MGNKKPRLSLAQIINMSMGFMGIQMAFALQNGNASRILSNFGADVHQLSWFWLVAPITGLLVQPIVGHLGDNTWTFMGRRKPYFLIGAIFCALGLIFLPNASTVTGFIGANVLLLAIVFLALMDLSVNVSMEPFRALVGDMLPKEQGTLGFGVQTILIGIGAVVGSEMPNWLAKLGIANTAVEGHVATNVIYSFYIGAIFLIACILYTIFTTKEYAPQELQKFEGSNDTIKEQEKSSFLDIFKDFAAMPKLMKQLGAVQFFSWFALFSMWVFTTTAVATHHFGLSPSDTHSETYNKAGDFVGHLFGLYNLFAVPFAFLLTPIAKRIGKKQTHMFALLSGGIGLISMYFIKDIHYLWISMLLIGFAWASILAMPYSMLIEAIPQTKMGVYMGIFNFFIVIPQIINGIIGGPIVARFFNNHAMYYLIIAGCCMIIGSILVRGIQDKRQNI